MTTPAQQYDANDFLMGSGVKAAAFDIVGTSVTGQICDEPQVSQQTDPKDGSPKFWNDGKPRMQLIVVVQTDERDPERPFDDGKRAFYVKAKLQDAVRQAVRSSGANGLKVGGTLTVTYVGDGQKTNSAYSAPKLYNAAYIPPSATAAAEFLNGGQPAPAAPQYAPQQPGQGFVPQNQGPAPQWVAPAQPAQQAAPQQPAPAQAAQDQPWTPPPGMDPTQAAALASLPEAQRKALGY